MKTRTCALLKSIGVKNADFNMNKTCRSCKHRERWALSDWSSKVVQCCNLQPSKRSNSGYKTIKVTDKACENYESILL